VKKQFPVPGTALADILGDASKRTAFHKKIQFVNKYMVFAYRAGLLPLLGAGRSLMLLDTLGRKSKARRYFPVSYVSLEGDIYLVSAWGKDSNWYKNIVAYPDDVRLQVGFRRFMVRPECIEGPEERRKIVVAMIEKSPKDAARLFGWNPQTDRIEDSDFSLLQEKVLFVRFLPR
jgi:deazaflavin-dependent oxidoreductase (nitroreductase family)